MNCNKKNQKIVQISIFQSLRLIQKLNQLSNFLPFQFHYALLYCLSNMKEEKRKSILSFLFNKKNNQTQNSRNIQQKQPIDDSSKEKGVKQKHHKQSQLSKGYKMIGTKKTLKSFHTNLNQNSFENIGTNQNQLKVNIVFKQKKSIQPSVNGKQVQKKIKRVGKKIWVSAYKQSVDQQQLQQKNALTTNSNLLTVNNSPSDSDYFSQFKQSSMIITQRSNNSRNAQVSDFDAQTQTQALAPQSYKQKQLRNWQQQMQNKKYNVIVNMNIQKASKNNEKQLNKRSITPEMQKQSKLQQQAYTNEYKQKQKQPEMQTKMIKIFQSNQPQLNILDQFPEQNPVNIQQVLQQIQKSQQMKNNIFRTYKISKLQPKQLRQKDNVIQFKIIQSKSVIQSQEEQFQAQANQKNEEFKPSILNQELKIFKYKTEKSEQVKKDISKSNLLENQSINMKFSKRPLLPAYPFNNESNTRQLQKIIHRQQIIKTSSFSMQKHAEFKQHNYNSLNTSPKKEQIKIKSQKKEAQRPIFQSLSNSVHKQGSTHRLIKKKNKNSQVFQTPKLLQSSQLKKSLKQFEMNKYIIQAKKQLKARIL